jgi:hypothetical protein
MHIIYGIIMFGLGIAATVKSESLLNAFGRVGFFEQYLGSEGGSRLGYKLLGLLIAFIGIMIMTGLIDGFMTWLVSPLVRGRF